MPNEIMPNEIMSNETTFTQIWYGNNIPDGLPDAKIISLPAIKKPTIASDYKRFELAADANVFLYADFDIEPQDGFFQYFNNFIKQKPPKQIARPRYSNRISKRWMPGFVCFAFYEGCPEACLFAHVNRPDFFKALLMYKKAKNIPDCYSWTFKVLRHFKNAVIKIPDNIYKHRHDTMFSETIKEVCNEQ